MLRNGETAAMAWMAEMSPGARLYARPRKRIAREPNATSSRANRRGSGGIVEDHADGVPLARVELAAPVIQFHLVVAANPSHRPAADRKNGGATLLERQNHSAGLHTGALLGHHEFAAFKVLSRLIQQDR